MEYSTEFTKEWDNRPWHIKPISDKDKAYTWFKKGQESTVENLIVSDVGGSLPNLVTENHQKIWIAYFPEVPGMVCSADSENKAIDALMVSLKVKLLHDRHQGE